MSSSVTPPAPGARPGPILVNTAFNCLATIGARASFRALWRLPFSSSLEAEDRCHRNGLALDGAFPAHVTAISRSDVADDGREPRGDGGLMGEKIERAVAFKAPRPAPAA